MSLRATHGRSHASIKDHEDWLLLVDYGDRLLQVCTKMSRVSDARRLDTCATILATCAHIPWPFSV